jgi:hypothetical protein
VNKAQWYYYYYEGSSLPVTGGTWVGVKSDKLLVTGNWMTAASANNRTKTEYLWACVI